MYPNDKKKNLFHLQRDEVFLHEDGGHATEFPQYVVVGPVQQDVQNPRPYLTPCRQAPRSAIAKAAQSPGPVGESRDHAGVSLSHLGTRRGQMSAEYCQSQKEVVYFL